MRRRDDVPDELRVLLAEVLKRGSKWKRLSVPWVDAEDVLQRALVRLIEHQHEIQPGCFRAWFRTAVYHETLDFLRWEMVRDDAAPLLAAAAEVDAAQRAPWPLFPSPEGVHDLLVAIDWLLHEVDPNRHAVAEQCVRQIVADGQVMELEALAAGLGLRPGTVGSHWSRAKKELATALHRERQKRSRSKIAGLLGVIAGLVVRLATSGRRFAGRLAAIGERIRGGGANTREQRATAKLQADRRRSRLGALVACALLPLALVTHKAIAADPSFDETMAAFAGVAVPLDVDADGPGARDIDVRMVAPLLTTNAEREREWGPPAPHAVRGPAKLQRERGLLGRAAAALRDGHPDVALDALRMYERDFPSNPLPAMHAHIVTALAASRSP